MDQVKHGPLMVAQADKGGALILPLIILKRMEVITQIKKLK